MAIAYACSGCAAVVTDVNENSTGQTVCVECDTPVAGIIRNPDGSVSTTYGPGTFDTLEDVGSFLDAKFGDLE